jgi:hypothetical protein
MNKTFISILFITMFAICIPAKAEKPATFEDVTLYPVDQGQYIESFRDFRKNLLEIAENKDLEALDPFIDRNINFTFGPGQGYQDFLKFWDLKPGHKTSRSETFWKEFKRVLKYGGSFVGEDMFAAPYYYSVWPDNFDSYTFGVIIGEDVNIYTRKGDTLMPAGTVTYKIVKPVYGESLKYNDLEYIGVNLSDGRQVYVYKYFAGRPIDCRAVFEKDKNAKWRLITFISGD